jgi:hypothetical protein
MGPVIYSNGIRSATAATKPFSLEPIHPVLRITRPTDGSRLPNGAPITLEGLVQDPEHPSGPRDAERLVWTVDEREVGTGPLTSVDPLESGEHTISLWYRLVDDPPQNARRRSESRTFPRASVRIVVAKARAFPPTPGLTGTRSTGPRATRATSFAGVCSFQKYLFSERILAGSGLTEILLPTPATSTRHVDRPDRRHLLSIQPRPPKSGDAVLSVRMLRLIITEVGGPHRNRTCLREGQRS